MVQVYRCMTGLCRLEGAAILTLACRCRVHDALYCAPVFVSMYLHASRYWHGAGTLVRDWFL